MITQENISYTADEIKAMVKTCEKYNKALDMAKKIYNSEFKPDEAVVLSKYLLLLFPELIEDEDERIRKAIIALIEFGLEDKSAVAPGHNVIKEEAIAWLEKQREQPTDNVEPKFKVGDYIKHNKANIICKVISVNSGSYYMENIETNGRIELFNAEQNFHLWTINDAKDDDVLVDEDNNIGLYLKEKDDVYWVSCVYLGCDGYLRRGGGYHKHKNTKPATKEQRNLLFQKMAEEGYEWRQEEKKLIKINESKFKVGDLA